MALIAPPALRPGDTVAVVAPSGPVPKERLAAGLKILESRYRVLVAPDILRSDKFLAGADERRAEEFNAALQNSDVRAIWAARGGYGASRIVDALDADALVRDPIPIVGFSDITVLLAWAASHGVRSIHGPVLTQLGELAPEEVEWALRLVEGGGAGESLPCASNGGVSGKLVGGNLSILAHLCGGAHALDFAETLCLIEDVGERPYALDRYLTQLLRQPGNQSIAAAKAVLLGDFTRCDEPGDEELRAAEMLGARLSAGGMALATELPVGHGTRNWAFPFGAEAELEGNQLRLLEPGALRH